MACKTSCKLCDKFIMSKDITLAGGNLVVNLEKGYYGKDKRFCIVFAQAIPPAPTNTPVVITIGDGTAQYPFTDSCCSQATVCDIRTRKVYPCRVITNRTTGVFRWVGKFCRDASNDLPALDGTAPAAPTA